MRHTHIDSYKDEEAHAIFQTYMYVCIRRYATHINIHMHTHSQTYTQTYFHTNAHTCRYKLLITSRDMSSRSNLSCPDTSYLTSQDFSRLLRTSQDIRYGAVDATITYHTWIWCTRCNMSYHGALDATWAIMLHSMQHELCYHTVRNVTMLTCKHYLSTNVAHYLSMDVAHYLSMNVAHHLSMNVAHYLSMISMNVALDAPMQPFAMIRCGRHAPCSCIFDARPCNTPTHMLLHLWRYTLQHMIHTHTHPHTPMHAHTHAHTHTQRTHTHTHPAVAIALALCIGRAGRITRVPCAASMCIQVVLHNSYHSASSYHSTSFLCRRS